MLLSLRAAQIAAFDGDDDSLRRNAAISGKSFVNDLRKVLVGITNMDSCEDFEKRTPASILDRFNISGEIGLEGLADGGGRVVCGNGG